MDFGSKYIYKYDVSSDESVSEDEDEILQISTRAQPESLTISRASEAIPITSNAAELTVLAADLDAQSPAERGTSVEVAKKEKKKKRLRKADTNVVRIKFNKLLQPGEMHAGDPIYCSQCGAIASHLSLIRTNEGNNETNSSASAIWKCEFCPQTDDVDIEQSDLPKKEDATYLVSPAPIVQGSDMTGVDDSIIIFVVDISGSMSSTTLVQGRFDLPDGLRQEERNRTNFDGERVRQGRHETYVSRLQGVQMAVEANLDKLVKENPTRRAALITFNHEITYYGDGTREEPLVIRGDKLNSVDEIVREAESEKNRELKPVSETKTRLTERIYHLEEGGQTALGPAILFALSIASKRHGSRIVVCTDGLANRGLGNLEMAQEEKISEEERSRALGDGNEYYANMTERARANGTAISVITIRGTTCLLAVIGQMADGTGGSVNIVDLLNIRKEFASILDEKVIATNVEATLIVHRGLYIRDAAQPDERLEKVKRVVGNVTKTSEIIFEFGIRSEKEAREKYQIDLKQLKQLPFQIQVTYIANDGSKALRVLTQLKEATEDRFVAESNSKRTVIAENHIRNTVNYLMAEEDEDEDDKDDAYYRGKTKWSSRVVQKQRLMYMNKLSSEQRKRATMEETDHFNEAAWAQANCEMQPQVFSSRERAKIQRNASNTAVTISAPINRGPSIFERVTNYFRSDRKTNEPDSTPAATTSSNRSFGFTTGKIKSQADEESERLYQLKNFTMDTIVSTHVPSEASPFPTIPLPLSDIPETEKMEVDTAVDKKTPDANNDVDEE